MLPALALVLAVIWILSQRRLGSNIMDNLKIHKPGPAFRNTMQLAYDHWSKLRQYCGLKPTDKTAAALARSWRVAGLTLLFQSMGYCWRAMAAISLHETGYGTSHAAYDHDNLWGVSFKSEAGLWVPYAYDSIAHAAEHLLMVLSADRYAEARAVKDDGAAFLVALNKAGYNSTAAWREGVLKAYGEMVLQ